MTCPRPCPVFGIGTNGYHIDGTVIYNPWSILSFIDREGKSFEPYWINTSSNDLIQELILDAPPGLQEDLVALFRGEAIDRPVAEHTVFSDMQHGGAPVLGFLLFSGYLTAVARLGDQAPYRYRLTIPNREVATLFRETVMHRLTHTMGYGPLQRMLRALQEGNDTVFGELLAELVKGTLSYHDTAGPAPERVYHAFVLGLLAHLSDFYEISSNRETGLGRCDIQMRPRKGGREGILIELKTGSGDLTEHAKDALGQIRQRDYATELRQAGIPRIRALGIAFDGKRIALETARL